MASSDPAQLELINWCRGEGIDVAHALMVQGVPEDEDTGSIEENMETVKSLGKVRVRGKMFNAKQQTLTVLCECREVIDSSTLPPQIPAPGGGANWKIVVARSDGFTEKLARFLLDEGKTMDDIQSLCSPSPSWTNSPESIIRAVGDVIHRTPKPTESNTYRRLRTFSGVSPTPQGEESLDSWLEQAKLMIEECECADKEKKKKNTRES